METTVTYDTVVLDGKEYRRKLTREKGLQEVVLHGKPTLVEEALFIQWPGKMGTTENYTLARPARTAAEQAAWEARVREAATQILIQQGIW